MTDKIHTTEDDLDVKEKLNSEDNDLDTLNTVSMRDRSNSIFESMISHRAVLILLQ